VELCKDAISGNSRQITPTYVATFANKRDSEHCTSTSNTYPKHTVRCYILKAQYHGPINYVRDSTNYNVIVYEKRNKHWWELRSFGSLLNKHKKDVTYMGNNLYSIKPSYVHTNMSYLSQAYTY